MNGLKLAWFRCPDGIELVDLGSPVPTNPKRSLLGQASDYGLNFRPRTERRVPMTYDINGLSDPMVIRYVNLATDEDYVRFFSRFGIPQDFPVYPHEAAPALRDRLEDILVDATSGDVQRSIARVEPILQKLGTRWGIDYSGSTNTARLYTETNSLENFMICECVLATLSGVRLGRCEHCGRAFLTGHTTGRRADAKYCSDKCRVAAMRKRNAQSH